MVLLVHLGLLRWCCSGSAQETLPLPSTHVQKPSGHGSRDKIVRLQTRGLPALPGIHPPADACPTRRPARLALAKPPQPRPALWGVPTACPGVPPRPIVRPWAAGRSRPEPAGLLGPAGVGSS
jgi:hypothetical protein